MPTPRNGRRVALESMRNVNRAMRWLVSRWDQAGTVIEVVKQTADDGSVFSNSHFRPRRDDERIELNAREWLQLANNLGNVIEELSELSEYAMQQHRDLLDRARRNTTGV